MQLIKKYLLMMLTELSVLQLHNSNGNIYQNSLRPLC